MKCICATSVSLGVQAFSGLGDVVELAETEFTPERIQGADAVITRSKTRLNRALLQGTEVKFAGTCTAGIDHADPEALAELGVYFASAPGCNANAVSEYVLAALLEAAEQLDFRFKGKTLGIIGHGQVGIRVERKARALGFRVLRNDPPKQAAGGVGPFVELETLLRESDVVTLHVPLVENGPTPTRGLLGETELSLLKPGVLLLNACRGEAVDTESLIQAKRSGRISWLVLDVWDPEPRIPAELVRVADLATPHIAGHSVEGKVNGTRQIREQLCEVLKLDVPAWDPEPLMAAPENPQVNLPDEGTLEERLRICVKACCDIRLDDRHLRESTEDVGAHFTHLRRSYRDRREFSATRIIGLRPGEVEMYRELGFKV
ncbi:MAG: 4-phosphoerythronate dehydrogenase [Kiritimatiellae bacterium]|jgi:erythronate-4-phosphate dehydrogenase|nr:4-phosphoerythronate dehydrogenase [Kiritimatiellia bacterium]